MTQPARVAVIGAAGWAGSRHVAAFHSLGTRIVALIDPGSGVHELAHKVEADVVDVPDRLTAGDVDLVVVALPSSAQPEVTADLLRRGLRVLVEKPIGSSAGNAAPLAQVDDIDENLMVGYTLHHHPAAKALTAWVTSSTVISISVRSAARKLQLDSWRVAPQEGGVAVINGIHAIEYVASMFPGTVTVDSVYASDQLHPLETHSRAEPQRLVAGDRCDRPRRSPHLVQLGARARLRGA